MVESSLSFQLNKIKRLIRVNGETFTFKRYKKNEYNELTDEVLSEIEIRGLYHEESSQVSFSSSDGSTTRTKPQPRVLCMPGDGSKIQTNDVVQYKGLKFKVVEPSNLGKLDICADISLEVIQNG